MQAENKEPRSQITNRDLLLPYLAPYFAYVLIASFFENRFSIELNYGLRLIVTAALLVWAWRWYVPLRGPKNVAVSIAVGICGGILGCVVWISLLLPFVDPYEGSVFSNTGFYLRVLAAGLIVPIFEEFFMRGYILRVSLQWDRARESGSKKPFYTAFDQDCIDDIEPGAWSVWAVSISTIAFALGHQVVEWPASLAYGALMASLWIARKDLISCIVAHGVTNVALAFYVRATAQWGLW